MSSNDPWDCDGKLSVFLGNTDDITWEQDANMANRSFRGKVVRDGIRIQSTKRDFTIFVPVAKKILERVEDIVRVRGRMYKTDGITTHDAVSKLEIMEDESRAVLYISSTTDARTWFHADLTVEEEEYESEDEDDEDEGEEEEDDEGGEGDEGEEEEEYDEDDEHASKKPKLDLSRWAKPSTSTATAE